MREAFVPELLAEDYEVLEAADASEALAVIDAETRIDLLITDMHMPLGNDRRLSPTVTAGGKLAGLAVARQFRKRFPASPIVIWTFSYDRSLREDVYRVGNAQLVHKRAGKEPVLDIAAEALQGFAGGKRPRIFIAHGHDHDGLTELVDYLTDDLDLPPPTVLRETASFSSTIIEKIEQAAPQVDVVFVLLTPDDKVLPSAGNAPTFRPRQNVIFELGYFYGLLGRSLGRVILLFKEPVELPTDIDGIVMINITQGIEFAAKEIKRELREWVKGE